MMTHYINIENGVLKWIRVMPEKPEFCGSSFEKDYPKQKVCVRPNDCTCGPRYEKYLKLLAKADSVEIAPSFTGLVRNALPKEAFVAERFVELKDGIYEITTNGVFEVRHKGFFNGGKVEWVRGHAPTNDYEELAYYSEEPKEDGGDVQFTGTDLEWWQLVSRNLGQEIKLLNEKLLLADSEKEELRKEVERLKGLMDVEHCPSLADCHKASAELTRLKAERERVIRFCEYKEFKDGLSATDAILSILKQKDGE